ncbi:MAG TPA: hypothetical protein VGA22_06750 [Gemmatimonadales bacterium]
MPALSVALAAAVLSSSPGSAAAQVSGTALIQQALDGYFVTLELEPDSAIKLLRRGLNPVGLPAAIWAEGVQSLVQILEENGSQSEARAWARWAVHRQPGLALTSVNLGDRARSLFTDARAAIQADSLSGPATVSHDWAWPIGIAPAGPGTVEFVILPVGVQAGVLVLGAGPVPEGGLPAGAGIYDAVVTGPAFDTVRVRLEVLPGVTTRVSVTPTIVVAATESALRGGVERSLAATVVAVRSERFELPESCEWGVRVGARLVFVRYPAIRGATVVRVQSGALRDTASVAQYDRTTGAVLQTTTVSADSAIMGEPIEAGQYLWVVGGPDCVELAPRRVRVEARAGDMAVLTSTQEADRVGSFLVDPAGRVVGLLVARDTVRQLTAGPLVSAARGSPRRLTPGEVARAENHILGALDITLNRTGTLTVHPLESWHWPELARSLVGSGIFVGPSGRYRIEVTDMGRTVWEEEVLLRPAETVRVQAGVRVAGQPGISVPRRKGKFPIIFVVLGAGAAGAAAFLLLGGKGTTPEGSGFGDLPIVITIP